MQDISIFNLSSKSSSFSWIKRFMFGLIVSLFCLSGSFVLAQDEELPTPELMIYQQQAAFAESSGLQEIDSDPRLLIILVIQVLMSFIAVALIAYAVYGGFIMMTANGDTEQISMGKTAIVRSIIGCIIIFSAYAVSRFIGEVFERNISDNPSNPAFLFPQDQESNPVPNDPLFERDDNFCWGVACEENGVSGEILPNTPDNGSGYFFEIETGN